MGIDGGRASGRRRKGLGSLGACLVTKRRKSEKNEGVFLGKQNSNKAWRALTDNNKPKEKQQK